MATFGITSTGFQIPQLTDIQTQINQTLITQFGANINLASNSIFGQISGIFAEREYLLWAAMQDVYNSQYPDTAFGASLDNVGAISGIPRLGALDSTIQNVKLFGTAGTVVPSGTLFSVSGSPANIFSLDANTTLVAGQSCIQTITFSLVPSVGTWQLSLNGHTTGTLAYNISAAALQAEIQALQFATGCTVTGNFTSGFVITFNGAGTGGFMSQPDFLVTLNTLESGMSLVTVTVTLTQAGIDQASVNMTATSTGPTIANAGTLTVINTPVGGLNAVLNVIDAIVGRNVETDNDYRARRSQVLQVAGAGTFEAIRSRLLALTGVTAVIMFENIQNVPDLSGRPPKSFEAVVQGGNQTSIANLLWQIKPAGIQTDGAISTTITDSQGQTHTIKFSRPTAVLIYVQINITVNLNYPANGDAAVIQAIVSSGDALGIGKEVVVSPYLIASVASIPGIEDIVLWVGTSPSPTLPDNIPIAANEIASFDTSRCNITHV